MQLIVYLLKYFSLALSFWIFYSLFPKKNKALNFWGTILVCFGMIIISGVRCNVGSDYYAYYRMYTVGTDYANLNEYIHNLSVQSGYPILMNIVKSISDNPYAIFWAVAIIVYPLIILWIYKYSNNPQLSLFLFFILDFWAITNNILKQTIAMAILLWMYELLLQKKYVIGLFLGLLASIFHASSVVIIIICFFALRVRTTQKLRLFLGVCGVGFTLFYARIATWVIARLPFLSRFSQYTEGREYSLPFLITSCIYIVLLIYFSKKFENVVDEKDISRVNLITWSIPFAIFSIRYIVIIRFVYLSILQLLILIPKYDDILHIEYHKLKIKKMLGVLLLVFFCLSITAGNNRYYDFHTYLNQKPTDEWVR